MTSLSFIFRTLYASAFIFATFANWAAFIEFFPTHGWRIPGIPPLSTVYFYSLLLIDPIASVLLILRPKLGVVFAGVIITTNVAHNAWLIRHANVPPDFLYWLTIAFIAFYFLTLYPVWRGFPLEACLTDPPRQSLQPTNPSRRG